MQVQGPESTWERLYVYINKSHEVRRDELVEEFNARYPSYTVEDVAWNSVLAGLATVNYNMDKLEMNLLDIAEWEPFF